MESKVPKTAISISAGAVGTLALGIAQTVTDYPSNSLAAVLYGVAALALLISLISWFPQWWQRAAVGIPLSLAITAVATYSFTISLVEPIASAEDVRNKYVCVNPLPHPLDAKGKYAVLLEFGANVLPTEGIFVRVETTVPFLHHDEWVGSPRRTDRQTGIGPANGGSFGHRKTSKDSTFIWVREKLDRISPTKSYYLYFEADKPIDAKRVGYCAIDMNDQLHENSRERS